jgi:hypothetical protein
MNHLAFGDLLVDRLSTTVTSVNTVLASIQLSGLTEASLITPAIHVYYVGEDIGDMAGMGIAYEIKQTWSTVIVTKNLRLPGPRRFELGEIITDVLHSLQGWKASNMYSPLYRENAPGPKDDPGGYTYFPLHFSVKILTSGDTDGY